MEAPQYDPRRDVRRKWILITAVVILLVGWIPIYWFWNWRQERIVNHFFEAIERKDFESAYGIKAADPDWKQHPQKYGDYPLGAFLRDWGPSGEWGTITRHQIGCSTHPPRGGSGVIVVVTINDRKDPARIWVEDKDQTLTDSPIALVCPHIFGQ